MSKNDPTDDPPRGMTRKPDHSTSEKAAKKVRRRTIRQLVLSLSENWPQGFTDEEMDGRCREEERKTDPKINRAESSYRKRRTELSDDFIILDSRTERPKKNGESAKVWVHRKFYPNPPPVIEQPKGLRSQALARRKQAVIMWNALVDCAYRLDGISSPAARAVAEALGIDYPIRVTEIPAKRAL